MVLPPLGSGSSRARCDSPAEVRSARMPRLEGYSFGRIVVDGEEHTRDLIVLPDRVVANWWRRDGHSLVMEDLEEVEADLPERLIVGCGAHGQLPQSSRRSSGVASTSRPSTRPKPSSATRSRTSGALRQRST